MIDSQITYEYPLDATWKLDIHAGAPGCCVVTFPVVVLRRTAKAALIRDPAGMERWLPLSKASFDRNRQFTIDGRYDVENLTLPVWLARKVWAEQLA